MVELSAGADGHEQARSYATSGDPHLPCARLPPLVGYLPGRCQLRTEQVEEGCYERILLRRDSSTDNHHDRCGGKEIDVIIAGPLGDPYAVAWQLRS